MIRKRTWIDVFNGMMLMGLAIMWGCAAIVHGQSAVVSFNLLKLYIPFGGILVMVFLFL